MIRRCHNENFERYAEWGGRGIEVCERWRGEDGFANFCADMGDKPTPKHTLDRKENSLGYCPENCRWATKKEQRHNQNVPVKMLTCGGETKPFSEWAAIVGISPELLHGRIRRGQTPEQALSSTARHYRILQEV